MILDNLNFFYFILAFSIGLFVCYVTTPPPKVVLKFPSPTNAGQVMYTDKEGQCYSYKAEKTNCPTKGTVQAQPVMEDFRNQRNQLHNSMQNNYFVRYNKILVPNADRYV